MLRQADYLKKELARMQDLVRNTRDDHRRDFFQRRADDLLVQWLDWLTEDMLNAAATEGPPTP